MSNKYQNLREEPSEAAQSVQPQPQYAPPTPAMQPGNYAAPQYAPYPYGGMQTAYPPVSAGPPPSVPVPVPGAPGAGPGMMMSAPYPPQGGMYAAPPGMYAAPVSVPVRMPVAVPGMVMGGGVVGALALMPPIPYVPPILPTDPSITSKFIPQSSSLTSSEKNYVWFGEVDTDDIRNFFVSQTGAPECHMSVMGHHDVHETKTDANGHSHTTTRRVIDWSFSVDLKPWILAPGEIAGLSIEEGVDRFIRSKGQMKSMELQKYVQFDTENYHQQIMGVARGKGFPHQVSCAITYINHSDKIVLLAPGDCNLCCNSPLVKCLLCVTCLCICWHPIKACMEEKFQLRQILKTAITPEQLVAISQDQVPNWYRY